VPEEIETLMHWGSYECLKCRVVFDVRLVGEARVTVSCPGCRQAVDLKTQWLADSGGYGSRGDMDLRRRDQLRRALAIRLSFLHGPHERDDGTEMTKDERAQHWMETVDQLVEITDRFVPAFDTEKIPEVATLVVGGIISDLSEVRKVTEFDHAWHYLDSETRRYIISRWTAIAAIRMKGAK
jgi:hypothetical protein